MAEPILTVEHLVKGYGENTVLDDVSLAVRPGEVIVVVGPSGCGKSTLLRCINALEPTQSGRVRLGNETVAYGGKGLTSLRQRIGMVFQSYELFPHLTVLDNVMLAPQKVAKRPKAEAQQEAEALLAGIVLDTKGFTMRTGSRTFETAAFLRKSGADTAQVNKFFQNDLRDTVTKFHIIQGAHTYRGSIALALTDRLVGRAIAGQAADELLNIAGIEASFVLFPEAGQAYLSARSNSDVNVQVISEMLGGGGNAATAGAQFPGKTPEEVLPLLKNAIDTYFDDEKS